MTSGRSSRLARGVFVANLVAQMAIVVTGAVVRLTGSGLGCPTWPECVEGSYVPTSRQEEEWHKYVEFGNRLLTFVLVLLAIAAIVAALMDMRRRAGLGVTRRSGGPAGCMDRARRMGCRRRADRGADLPLDLTGSPPEAAGRPGALRRAVTEQAHRLLG